MNYAMLAKWWWRFNHEKNSFCVKVVSSLYDAAGSLGLDGSGNFRGQGGIWNNIIFVGSVVDSLGLDFSSSFTKKHGDGLSISFWLDNW